MSISEVHLFTRYKSLIEAAVIELSDTHDDILNEPPILEIDCAELLKQVRALRGEIGQNQVS